jgi:hypothetical protein
MVWLHDYPAWLVAVATIAVFVATGLAGLAVSRRWSRRRGLHALVDNAVIGWIFSAILGIYAIAIGLIAVASWGNVTAATSVASHEAAAIAALYRDLGGYPAPLRSDLQSLVAQYTRYVIDEAWPLQRLGEIPHGGTDLLNQVQRALYAFEPPTEGGKITHGEALQAFNRLIEYRRQRLEAVNYAVPGTLWSVVLIGAAIAVTASFVFDMESFHVHALMTSLLAGMIGLLVFFIAITDLPYRGARGVQPDAYELVLHDLIERP